MTLKAFGAGSSLPVTAAEFHRLIGPYLRQWNAPGRRKRIGLAVSGGGDSIALAYLCRQLISEKLVPDLWVNAFTVDHRVRQGSTEEARKVGRWMKEFGFKHDILTLQWPDHYPRSSPQLGFETLARKLRYQALGQACADRGIRALFLGHHQDDNIETALFRLAAYHRRPGLTGFDDQAPIPECDGMYGVSRSGSSMTLRSICQNGGLLAANPNSTAGLPLLPDHQLHIAMGGVELQRPFRTIPKSRLLATCNEAGVPFVTDMTNMDPTLTPRNSVRKLLTSPDDLPRALQPESLSSLVEKCRKGELEEKKSSDSFLQYCKIINFDLRAGSLVVQLPSPQELRSITSPLNEPIGEDVNVQVLVLQRLNDLVCPQLDRVSASSRIAVAPLVFPRRGSGGGQKRVSSDVFTLGSVIWSPVKPQEGRKPPSHPGDYTLRSQASLATDPKNTQPNLWLLSRRPPNKHIRSPLTKFSLDIPEFYGRDRKLHTPWTDWKLWDGRYWVRLRAFRSTPLEGNEYYPATSIPVTMRLLDLSDMAEISEYLSRYRKIWMPRPSKVTGAGSMHSLDFHHFKQALGRIAKGKTRLSMPVLTVPSSTIAPLEADKTYTGLGDVYGFPSIHAALGKHIRIRHPPTRIATSGSEQGNNEVETLLPGRISAWNLNWNIMYKEIDREVIRLTGYSPAQE